MIRFFDIVFSVLGLVVLAPLFLCLYVAVCLESRGGGFYRQRRVGKDGREFVLYKFRSMRVGSDRKGLLTVGGNDARLTKTGAFIRRYKLDELPQLFNVLKGDMSLVGPRPEVPRYVALYTDKQRQVLSVRPGITDYASIAYIDENKILGQAENPEETYVCQIMPAKIEYNMKYIRNRSIREYFKVIFLTFGKIVRD